MATLNQVLTFWKRAVSRNGFDRVLNNLRIVSVSDGNCVAEFKVETEHTNPMGTLHGGYSMTVIDTVTSMACGIALQSYEKMHVSANMNVSFIKAAKVGDEVVCDAKALKTGKNVAYLQAELRNKVTGDLLVKAIHTKFIMGTKTVK